MNPTPVPLRPVPIVPTHPSTLSDDLSTDSHDSISNTDAVIEVYAEWGGRCEPLVPVLKRIQKEAEYAQNCAVVLHCKAESHDLLAEYRGKSMPHFLFYRNGTQVASVAGANMPEIEALLAPRQIGQLQCDLGPARPERAKRRALRADHTPEQPQDKTEAKHRAGPDMGRAPLWRHDGGEIADCQGPAQAKLHRIAAADGGDGGAGRTWAVGHGGFL